VVKKKRFAAMGDIFRVLNKNR
jgi:hypothetical protein